MRCGNPGVVWGFLFDSEDGAGDFAFRVDSAGRRHHDADRPRRAALLVIDSICKAQAGKDRAGAGGAVRGGHGRQAGSQEPAGRPGARRPVPGQGSEPHRIGVRDRRRVPSRREAGGRPHLEEGASHRKPLLGWERRIEPELSGSRRGIGTARVETRRRRALPGDSGPRIARRALRGPGPGPGSAPGSDGCIVLRKVRPVAGLRSPEKLTGFRSGRLLGASSRRRACTLNRLAVANGSVAHDTMARH